MALTKFTTSMDIISALDDEPNDVGGLSAAELKAKFDEGCKAVQTFLNETLTKEIDEQKATKEELQGVVLGQIPDGTITAPKLASSFTLPIEKGGTGATTPEAARSNLGIVQTITRTTAPTTSTVGVVGQFYLNTATGISYQCTAVNGSVYTWELVTKDPFQVGEIRTSTANSFASNYLLCNGTTFNPITYPELSTVLPTSFNALYMDSTKIMYDIIYVPSTGFYVIAGLTSDYYPFVYYATNINGPWTYKQISSVQKLSQINITYYNGNYYIGGVGTPTINPYVLYCNTLAGTWTCTLVNSDLAAQLHGIAANDSGVMMTYSINNNGYYYSWMTYCTSVGGNWTKQTLVSGSQIQPNGAAHLSYVNGYFVVTYTEGQTTKYCYTTAINCTSWTGKTVSTNHYTQGPMTYINGYYIYGSMYYQSPYSAGFWYTTTIGSGGAFKEVASGNGNVQMNQIIFDSVTGTYIVVGYDGLTTRAYESTSLTGTYISPSISNYGRIIRAVADVTSGGYFGVTSQYGIGRMRFLPKISSDKSYAYIKAFSQ